MKENEKILIGYKEKTATPFQKTGEECKLDGPISSIILIKEKNSK